MTETARGFATPLPGLDPIRCVHALTPLAGCSGCVDACPSGAWRIGATGPDLDPDACDGCGLCAPACPQEAIRIEAAPVVVRGTAYAACARVIPAGQPGHLPCLHALGIAGLRDLHRREVYRLALSLGECASCPRGGRGDLLATIGNLNRLLGDRGLPRFSVERVAPAVWSARTRDILSDEGPDPARRGLLQRLFGARGIEAPSEIDQGHGGRMAEPLFALQRNPGQINIWAPQLDPRRCTGCDVCARLCPQQAITIDSDGTAATHYRITPDRCNGCHLCRDLCIVGAIRLLPWANGSPQAIPLHPARCPECGTRFHRPQANQESCPVCAARVHPRRTNRLVCD